jgi:hypothetical protein
VAEPDKFFGQEGNDSFCATIESRGNALNQWSDLRDLHDDVTLSRRARKRRDPLAIAEVVDVLGAAMWTRVNGEAWINFIETR